MIADPSFPYVVESDERSSDFESHVDGIRSQACEAESIDAKPLGNCGAGDYAIP
jgi:hypothetical protein